MKTRRTSILLAMLAVVLLAVQTAAARTYNAMEIYNYFEAAKKLADSGKDIDGIPVYFTAPVQTPPTAMTRKTTAW